MLCDVFGITTGTGSKIFITWILFLEKELSFLLPFSTKEELNGVPKPNCFTKKSLNNLRAIIDCTEFYVENLVSHSAKDLPTVNTSLQTHLSYYLFQCLLFCISTLCRNYTVEVSVTRRL